MLDSLFVCVFVVSCWLFAVGCWLFVVGCRLVVVAVAADGVAAVVVSWLVSCRRC